MKKQTDYLNFQRMESIEDHWEDKLGKALMYLSQKQIYQQVSL